MVMTQNALLFIGLLATLASIGMFQRFGDEATRLIISFVASVLWASFGLSAFNVRTVEDVTADSEPILPLAYLGIALSIATFLFVLYHVKNGLEREVSDAELSDALR